MLKKLSIKTGSRTQFLIIDGQVEDIVRQSGIQEGLCLIWVPHTTAGVTINENADPSVVRDILNETEKIVPFEDGYSHFEGNSAAHIKSSLFGPSIQLIISKGKLVLGTWQSLYFCEFDGPRNRKVILQIRGK